MNAPRILVFGYGNPGRQDDGLGPEVAARLERLRIPGVEVDSNYQLNIEDGATLAGFDIVLFVDASTTAPEPFERKSMEPASTIAFTTHAVSGESALAICEDHFGERPEAWMLAVRGYSFEFEEKLTPRAEGNCRAAVAEIRRLIQTWKDRKWTRRSITRKPS